MATSPIYSWPEPDNTDLVKNGALAIRTLGDAIDTTMATMVPKTTVDAKGDIIAATAADTVSRLAVGANNTVLTADSSTATGLKWATPSSGSSFSGALVGQNSVQSIPNATFTAISFNTELVDSGSYWVVGSPTRLTVPTTGKYQYNFHCGIDGTTGRLIALVKKNGTTIGQFENGNNSSLQGFQASQITSLAANDYLEFFVYQSTGSAKNTEVNGDYSTQASVVFLGA